MTASRYLTLDDVDVEGKRVLMRADFNVPLQEGRVADDYRIRAALPTIHRVRAAGAVVVVCSHLGRPQDRESELSLAPVATAVEELGGFPVQMLDDVVGSGPARAVGLAAPGDVLLLENTRFEPGELVNDPGLARALAALGDIFVFDAFGTAHRAHASTVGVADHLVSVAGPLVVAEVDAYDRLLTDPERPLTVVIGGAKVSDKLAVIWNLLPRIDLMVVGGGLCFTMLRAEGYEIGESLVEEDMLGDVAEVFASEFGTLLTLPTDVVVGDRFAADAEATVVPVERMPKDGVGLDIGPDSAARFAAAVSGSGTVFWNGPMGVFEWEPFRLGTEVVARAFRDFEGFSVAGGGDTVAALRQFGLDGSVSHLSTGGGAGLELLEGRSLPALDALERWADGA